MPWVEILLYYNLLNTHYFEARENIICLLVHIEIVMGQ